MNKTFSFWKQLCPYRIVTILKKRRPKDNKNIKDGLEENG